MLTVVSLWLCHLTRHGFRIIFHPEMTQIESDLIERKKDKDINDFLDFDFIFLDDTKKCRCLVPYSHLFVCLANISIDTITKCNNKHKSRIICFRKGSNTDRICFKILTNYTDHIEATNNLVNARNFSGERNMLKSFGVDFKTEWLPASEEEAKEGFTAAFGLSTPSGYLKKG